MRPHLEYAAPVWDPHLIKDITKLENVQKFAMKMCSKQWDLGYQDLIELSQLPTVQNRRLYLRLCTLYKIIHGYFYFPPSVLSPKYVGTILHYLYYINPLHTPMLFSPLLHSALFQYGTTYRMMHSQHTL